MGIVLGFLCLLTLLLLLLKAVTHRFQLAEFDNLLMKYHKYFCAAFVILCLLHILFVFPLLKTRDVSVYVLGVLTAIVLGLLVVSYHIMGSDKTKRIRWHRILSVVLLLCTAAHITAYSMDFQKYQEKIKHIDLQKIAISQRSDGQYIGEYDAGYIYAKVLVTVSGGRILEIQILKHHHEKGKAAENITENITDTQQFPVDAVSGATNSSKVIQQAIQNALEGNSKNE